ncbi:hypothetical protein ACX6XY_27240 [Streptomyces sp. O3]
MPRSTSSACTCNYDPYPDCTAPEHDEMSALRCAILTLLDQGRWMVGDDIPLPEILSGGGDYLRRLRGTGDGIPVPALEHWAWLEAELRLVVARAAGLDAVSTLDPRIDVVLAEAARLPEFPLVDLLDRAAEQFAEPCNRPRTA